MCLREATGPDSLNELEMACFAICCDNRMQAVWPTILAASPDEGNCSDVARALVGPAYRARWDEPFDLKSNAERLAWLAATRKAATRLHSLLSEGPGLMSENVLDAMPDEAIDRFLNGIGVKRIPNGAEKLPNENLWRVWDCSVNVSQRGAGFYLRELLEKLISELYEGVPSAQTVSKPRDAKAYRARYILEMTSNLRGSPYHLTDEQVATVTAVALADDGVTAAVANRFRWRRKNESFIGQEMQHSSPDDENIG